MLISGEDGLLTEQLRICLEENLNISDVRHGYGLAGFLILEKKPLASGVKHAFQREWKHIIHSDDVKIAWVSPNVYVITVNSEEISRKLIKKGPWFENNDVFAIQLWLKECTLEEITLNKATFWIQIHGFPLGFLTTSCACPPYV